MIKSLKINVLLLLGFLTISCDSQILQVKKPNGEKSLTIFLENEMVFVYPGLITKTTDTDDDYLQFDISSVPPDARALFICWGNEVAELEILCPKARIVKGETKMISVYEEHFIDKRGLPDIMYFHKDGCFEVGLDPPFSVFPSGHAIIIKEKRV